MNIKFNILSMLVTIITMSNIFTIIINIFFMACVLIIIVLNRYRKLCVLD